MQSILHNKQTYLFPDIVRAVGPLTQKRQSRLILIYAGLYVAAFLLVLTAQGGSLDAFGHSLVLPGSGFLGGWSLESGIAHLGLGLCVMSLALLTLAGLLWFATGNVILPPLIWTGLALSSAGFQASKVGAAFDPAVTGLAFSLGPVTLVAIYIYRRLSLRRGQIRRDRLNAALALIDPPIHAAPNPQTDELSFAQLQHMRLLLDRALQPVDEFEGFEWLDQFQTAAVRYQINFISYALSMAQAYYMPDFTGYLSEAQLNLKAKQENHRIWKYWQLENIWGNLRKDADPIARDNIMYSGFVGAQLAYARQAGPRGAAHLDGLNGQSKTFSFAYRQDEIMRLLAAQYKQAGFGLLSCEPNWIYPLCNAITATAIRAHDTQEGTDYWSGISGGFRQALETEFMTPSGELVPFRSNYTGFAPPQIGGAVMQAFPCFFLNAVLPDIARRQWNALKISIEGKSWRRALWPADVGNYNFSRASSYAATALAAREMGDDDIAELLLGYLQTDCPLQIHGGAAHYSKASLWANANAFMARIGRANGLQDLVTQPASPSSGPYLAHADPARILVAKARSTQGALAIIAYPADKPGPQSMTIAALAPRAAYKLSLKGVNDIFFTAADDGTQIITADLNGRTELNITPIS